MKIIFWCKGERSIKCLEALNKERLHIELIVLEKEDSAVTCTAKALGIKTIMPEDPNKEKFVEYLKGLKPDLFILGGYGRILKKEVIGIPRIMCINLHGGKLPKYRGSSPMNWALINDEKSFMLSIIKVDSGVDTGDVLMDKAFKIDDDSTIRDLHAVANSEFPKMLVEVVKNIKNDNYAARKQDPAGASYYPLRFPEDGLIVWDMFSARQVYNRIRALTDPYPCAFTFFNGRKVILVSAEMSKTDFFGEPGRIYRKTDKGILICASDKCLWVKEMRFEDSARRVLNTVKRYDRFATLRESVLKTMGQ